jgi:transcriptional antiterminator RfaH
MPLDANSPQCVATPEPAVGDLGCGCNSPRAGWVVATTHPQAEAWADTNLQRRGYRCFLPRYPARRPDRATPTLLHIVLAPLWPGYLFVHHDSRDSWRPIYETPGVRSVLKHGNQIQWVNAGAVEAIQAAQAFAATQPPETSQWRPGDAVAPRVGPLVGLPGVVLAVEGENAVVGILFLGQLREVVYPFDALVSRDDF